MHDTSDIFPTSVRALAAHRTHRPFVVALLASLLSHALALLLPAVMPPAGERRTEPLLQATLATPRDTATPTVSPPSPPTEKHAPSSKPRRRPLLTAKRASNTGFSVPPTDPRQDAEMDKFLDGLTADTHTHPPPTLAQRALAQARSEGRHMEAAAAPSGALVELRPNAPPPDPFSLELYVDSLLKKLNRSAAFVRNDPHAAGVRNASIEFRINPDGSLRSFGVLNAGDQADEIAFIRAIVERAAPFARFPHDLDASARSLGMTICIEPAGGGNGFGFSRLPEGHGCPRG